MKKVLAALILAAAAASPALASEASDVAMHANAQPGYTAMWNGAGAYASAQNVTWHQATSFRRQVELDGINR